MCTAFTSELMSELANLLEIQLKNCTQTGTNKRVTWKHAPFKQVLQINENESSTDWHRYLDIAIFIHNTTYAPAPGCTPSDVFHGRTPVKPLDIIFLNTKLWEKTPSTTVSKNNKTKLQTSLLALRRTSQPQISNIRSTTTEKQTRLQLNFISTV